MQTPPPARTIWTLIALAAWFAMPPAAGADIYRYRDTSGVWHYSNTQTSPRYRVFIRTGRFVSAPDYLAEYDDLIQEAADAFGVDPFLIRAVITAESDFDEQAVSPKGAQGLMQLMPATAEDLCVEDPFDPKDNIRGGVRYLSQLLRRFSNNTELAVAAYNAGPERVETHKRIPPYPETQKFVARVMGLYQSALAGNP